VVVRAENPSLDAVEAVSKRMCELKNSGTIEDIRVKFHRSIYIAMASSGASLTPLELATVTIFQNSICEMP